MKNKHDLEYLLANTEVVLEQTQKQTISNPTGYLLKALQNDYRPLQNGDTNAPIDRLPHGEEQAQGPEVSIQDQIAQLTKTLDAEELSIIQQSFLMELSTKEFMKKVLDSKGFDHPIIQGQWLKYLQDLA
ncbi:MAG: hypothetical protein R2879_22045 [Saprospiraceae bacterium]